MTAILVRFVLVALAIATAYGVVTLLERRRGRRVPGLAPGVTVFTGPGCTLCSAAVGALAEAGVAARAVDVSHPDARTAGVRALPTVLVVDEAGGVVLRRSGRAAISDAHRIAGIVA